MEDFIDVIFLDIDGVMNSAESFARKLKLIQARLLDDREQDYPAEPMVSNLNYITEKTGAKIVISSTWRLIHHLNLNRPEINNESLRSIFKKSGISAEIVGVTPRLNESKCRGKEIDLYLKNFRNIDGIRNFVIIDDDSDMEPHMDKLVKTTWEKGLTKEHAEKAIEILMRL